MNPELDTIYNGNCLDVMRGWPPSVIHCCVTSPPYWGLRDYGVEGQLGLEKTPEEYVEKVVTIFREVKRVLRDDGVLWLNLGDSYCASATGSVTDSTRLQGVNATQVEASKRIDKSVIHGLKPKDLVGIPWRVAFALQADGWYLRSDIIWHKINPMPESVRDRPTKGHEYIFLMSKSQRYYYDADAIKEKKADSTLSDNRTNKNGYRRERTYPGSPSNGGTNLGGQNTDSRNKRSVWTIATHPYKGAHFATFPPKLIEPCIKAGCRENGTVLDPFMGAGTTALVAWQNRRRYVGCELNQGYIDMAEKRLQDAKDKMPLFDMAQI